MTLRLGNGVLQLRVGDKTSPRIQQLDDDAAAAAGLALVCCGLVHARSCRTCGLSALVSRWAHPGVGYLTPATGSNRSAPGFSPRP